MQRRISTRNTLAVTIILSALLVSLLDGHVVSAMAQGRLKVLNASQVVNGIMLVVRAARLEGNQIRFDICYPIPQAKLDTSIDRYTLRNVTLVAQGQTSTGTSGWLDEWQYPDGSRIPGWQMNSSAWPMLLRSKGLPTGRCDWLAFTMQHASNIERAALTIGGLGVADGTQATTYQPANLGLDQVKASYTSGPWQFDLWLK